MPLIVKLLITNLIILTCTHLGKRYPSLGGLIATMPLTTLIVLVWLARDNPGDTRLLADFTRGVVWGIGPTILFFVVALFCFQRGHSLTLTLAASFGAWLVGAVLHQTLLH